MNVALRTRMTVAEFLAWEEAQDDRWEFDGFAPVAMVGGTVAHGRICRNLITVLTLGLRGKPCEAFREGVKLVVAGSVRYPDAFVACGPNENASTVAENPVVVFEVLSSSTQATDMMVKNAEYRDTPSVRRYVMLAQTQPMAMIYERVAGQWIGTVVTDPAAMLDLPEIGAQLPLAGLYEGVIDPA